MAAKAQADQPSVDDDGNQSPYLSIMNRAIPLIVKLAGEMGFTTAAWGDFAPSKRGRKPELFNIILPTGERSK